MENKTGQKYLKQVRHFLVCDRAGQKQLLAQCKKLVDSFQQENPHADYDGFVSAFGKPSDCAADLLSTLDASRVESTQQKRRWFRSIIIVSILSVFAFLSFFWYTQYQKSIKFDEDVMVIIEAPTEVTIDEFIAAKEQETQFSGGKK